MKVEARLFDITTAFFFLAALVYGLWAKEPVGTVGLILTGGLSLIIGSYFHFVARRVARRPEDNPEAEISDGAGEVGLLLRRQLLAGRDRRLRRARGASSLAFWQIWLLVVALVCVLAAVGGLVFEYHTRPERH